MREALQSSLTEITTAFLRMQSLTLEQVTMLREAVGQTSFQGLGGRLRELDREVDRLEVQLEEACLGAIARHQPMAGDLRFLLMVFKSLSDVERVGDYAKSIGRDLEELSQTMRAGPLADVLPLLTRLTEMIEKLAFAFAERDARAAAAVTHLDDDVDALYEVMQRSSITRVLENPRDLPSSLQVSRLARSLERLGDHVVNVAEHLQEWLESRPAH